jgi:hypothetical protein
MNDQDFDRNAYKKHRRGIFFPLLILSAGILLLLSNFGYLPGGFWGFVSMYWPVIFIIGGLDGLFKGEGITGSLLFAGFGAVLLAGNLGYLSLSTWDLISKAWPLILIGIGLDIIIGRRTFARVILGLVLAVVLVMGLLWVSSYSNTVSIKTETFHQEYNNETNLVVDLERTAGAISVTRGAPGKTLMDGKLGLVKTEGIDPVVESSGNETTIKIKNTSNSFPASVRSTDNADWKFVINSKPQLTLSSKVIFGANHIDTRGLNTEDIHVETSTGQSVVYVADVPGTEVNVNGAIGEIVIYLPKGASVRVNAEKAIGGLSFPESYSRDGNLLISPNYKAGSETIEVQAVMPIGAIRLVEYSPE